MSEFLSRYGVLLLNGTLESLYMTLVPTLLAYVIGLPLGVLLTVTKPGGFMETPQFNAAFGWLVNIFRSIPFMILMLFLTPFTRAVMGTSIGASAANLPLTVAAAPFVARMVEQSLEEVDGGVIEAARCMGATNWQIITRVMIPEAVPSLIRGLSITTITLIGYSAMAGAVGGGGLGDVALRYGYHRYQADVMMITIVLLVIIVCIIQIVFDHLASRVDKRNR